MDRALTMLEAMQKNASLDDAVGIRFQSSPTDSVYRSYVDLDRQSRIDANILLESGGVRNGRVLLIFEAGMEFVRGLYATFYAGMVAVPVPVTVSRDQEAERERIRRVAADCGARVALTVRAVEGHLGPIEGLDWLVLPEHADDLGTEWVDPGTGPHDTAVIQYTSGSVGTPKGVVVSHGNLVANQRSIMEVGGVGEGSLLAGWLPHYHDMGLGLFMQSLYGGFPLVFTSPQQFLRRPVTWLRLISDYGATLTAAPDFAYALCARLVRADQCAGLNLSTLRTMITGAEPVRAETLDAFARRFVPLGLDVGAFMPAYGLAETTLLVTGKRHGEPVRTLLLAAEALEYGAVDITSAGRTIELVSCGVPAERHEVAIVDPQAGTRLPDGVVGEIWISGPSVTQGYWGRPEATRDSFGVRLPGEEAKYLRTGDLGLLSDGELFVTGRLKDLIIVRGRNVVPADLEFACAELFGTPADCLQAAFEQDGQSVVVVVEVDTSSLDRARAALPEVREQIARRFSLQALQIVLTRRGTLPRTTSGKVRRGEARTLVSRGDLATIAVAGSGPVSRDAGQVPIPA